MTDIAVRVIANGSEAHLFWKPLIPVAGCLGFAVYRRRNGGAVEVLKNRVGFSPDTDQAIPSQPSTLWPFQRIDWTDHAGNPGDSLSYQVVAMTGRPGNLKPGPASAWTDAVVLQADCGDGVAAYFNRGIVLSQFVARLMRERHWTPADLKTHAGLLDDPLRDFLGGQLRSGLLALLDEAIRDVRIEVHAALFELGDAELGGKLAFLGPRLHCVLGNGAAQHRNEDENAAMRASLVRAGADVRDRMSAPSFLAHNKFAVLSRSGVPWKVWTGSTNWQPTGLCTQVNNGIVIEQAEIAADYRAAWQRLKEAGNGSTDALKAANSALPAIRPIGNAGASAYARFSATRNHIDLDELSALIDSARHSLFFLMFMPGKALFEQLRAKSAVLYTRGVVNTFPATDAQASADGASSGTAPLQVDLLAGSTHRRFDLDVVRPEGIEQDFAAWAAEVTRRQFGAIGHAIVHSKVVVIDAGTPQATVVTGSHNFSSTASKRNDENFLAVRGNRKLAAAYATNCLSVYDHYRWRQYVADCVRQGRKPWDRLDARPDWLQRALASPSKQATLRYWFDGDRSGSE